MTDATRVKVIRRAPYHFGPGPKEPTLVEAPSDRFDMSIKPDAVDDRLSRLEFNWRSPAQNLLMSPKVYLEFDVEIRAGRDISQITQACAGVSMVSNVAAAGPQAILSTHRKVKRSGLLGFGAGDPLLAACESASLTINGSSLSTPSPTLWSRPFLRSNLTSDAAQEIYGQAGGAYDAYDSTGTKCFVRTEAAGNVSGVGYGFGLTADTGLQTRCRNFYNQIYKQVAQGENYKGAVVDARGVRVCKVRWPVSAGGVLNAWLGADIPRHSPVAGAPFGLANMNSVALSLLFRANALETLIRDYGSAGNTGENDIGFGRLNELGGTLTGMTVDTDSVRLICRYYRLAPNREVPVSFACKIWRPMISLGDPMPKGTGADSSNLVPASGIKSLANAAQGSDTIFSDSSRTYLMPSGRDFVSLPAVAAAHAPNMAAQIQVAKHADMWEVEWSNLSYPMLPSQIMICAPKDSFSFNHRQITHPGIIGGRSVLSRDSSLAIKQLEISVNTTERTYKYTRDVSCLDDQNILLQDTLQNVQRGFFNGDFDAFRTRNHFVLLSSDQFCPIPQMSAGITSPVQITIRAKFQNECVFVDGLCEVDAANIGTGAIVYGADAIDPQPTVSADLIRSRPVVVAFFQRSTLQIAPSSATVSVQSYSQSSGAEILAANR